MRHRPHGRLYGVSVPSHNNVKSPSQPPIALTLVTTTDRSVVKGLKDAAVSPWVFCGVETVLASSVGRCLGENGEAEEVCVPRSSSYCDSSSTNTDGPGREEGLGGLRVRRVEPSLYTVSIALQTSLRRFPTRRTEFVVLLRPIFLLPTFAKACAGDARAEARAAIRGKAEESIGREEGRERGGGGGERGC